MKKFFVAVSAIAALVSTPALAASKINGNGNGNGNGSQTSVQCDVDLPSPSAVDCSGYHDKNLLGGSDAMIAAQIAALADLGYDFDGDWSSVEDTKITSLQNGNQIDFGQTLYGMTYIAAHFGNIAGPAQNVTVFWAFDFGTEGADFVTLTNTQGFSNAVLFSTGTPAVPEPSTWLLMLFGFGAVGFVLRRRPRRHTPALA